MSRKYCKNKFKLKSSLPEMSPCPYCNSIMKNCSDNKFNSVTIDHIKPKSVGGDDEITNLIPVCKYCNNKKSSNKKLLSFRLLTPQELKDEDYVNLSRYVEMKTRVTVLQKIKKHLSEGEFEEAEELISQTKELVSQKKFYHLLLCSINASLKSKSIIVQIKKSVSQIEDKISNEIINLNDSERQIKHFNFTTYSLIAY